MKKRILKVTSALLSLVLLFGCAVGCKSNKPTTTQTEQTADMDQGVNREKTVGNLVKNAQSDYKILIPSDADECVQYAANELCKYVSQTSGAVLPIVKDDEVAISLSGKYISLGNTNMLNLASFDVDYNALNSDGFVIKTLLNSVYITAERNSGVLYGVYDFCERILGTRFLTNDYTYIEESDTVVLYEMDRTEIPAFSMRYYYAKQSMSQLEFVTRQRQTPVYGKTRDAKYGDGGLHTYYEGMGHTALVLLDPDEYYEAHNDWYVDGEELCYTNGITDDGELDLTKEDSMTMEMIRVCKEKILQNTTNADTIMIGQPDNNVWCSCTRCAASDAKYGGRSGTLLTFINAVAKALEEWNETEQLGKKITVETFAYYKTIDPPMKKVTTNGETSLEPAVVARDNVAVQIAWMGCNYHSVCDESCSTNLTHATRFKNWQKCASNLTIWDYATNFYDHIFWFENFDSLVANYKYYLEIGATRVMTQGAPHVSNYYQGHLENYVVSKLQWNPCYDVNELINEFNYYYYGEEYYETANSFVDYMRAYYKMKNTEYSRGFHTDLYAETGFQNFEHYTISFLTRADAIVQEAIDDVEKNTKLSDAERESLLLRLWQIQIQPEYMILKNYDAYYDPSTQKEYAKAWLEKIDRLGITYYGEGKSIASLKTEWGIA